ncbi:MAG: 50S ribosomal protein L25 [bacterium]|nr:50S ribosomal protein L25 [bacterium]
MVEKEKKLVEFTGKIRSYRGKGASRSLRRSGFIPAVVYGADEENKLISIEKKSAEKTIRHISGHNVMADLVIEDSGSRTVLKTIVKEIQFNPITGEILHIDFYHIGKNQPVKIIIPLKLVGECTGVKEGGILEQEMREIEVEGLPDSIPENIEIDITNLKIGESIHLKDIIPPEGVRLIGDAEHVIATILAPKAEEAPAPEEVATTEEIQQPKVITQEIAEERRKEREARKETEKGS